ncbi:MAG: RNA polymerase sigma factor [Terriglobales bacterium]
MLAGSEMVLDRLPAAEAEAQAAQDFAALVGAHGRTVFRVAYLVVQDAAAAEEVAQDAFLRAWRGGRWRNLDRPGAWLARVAWRLALDRRKARGRAAGTPLPVGAASPAPGAERQLAAREEVTRLRALIAALPPALREPLQLTALDELETADVARILDISPAAVRRRLMRAREMLRQRLVAPPVLARSLRGRRPQPANAESARCREKPRGNR